MCVIAACAAWAGPAHFAFDAAGPNGTDSAAPTVTWDFKGAAAEALSARGFIVAPKDPKAIRLDPQGFLDITNDALAQGQTGVVSVQWPLGLPQRRGAFEALVAVPTSRAIVKAEIQLRREGSVLARVHLNRRKATAPGQSTIQTGAGREEIGWLDPAPMDFAKPVRVRMEWHAARVVVSIEGEGIKKRVEGAFVLNNPADPDNIAFALEGVAGGVTRTLRVLDLSVSPGGAAASP